MAEPARLAAAPPLEWQPQAHAITAGPVQQSEQLDELAAALVDFQAAVTGAGKGGDNPHFRSQFVRLTDAWNAARGALTGNGLCVTQWPGRTDNGVSVTTRIMHSSGQWIQSTLEIGLDTTGSKNIAQQYGSTITYAQRYAFLAALGLPPEDDDGQSASPERKRKPKPRTAPAGKVAAWKKKLEACDDLEALKSVWGLMLKQLWDSMSSAQRDDLTAVKDECKEQLQAEANLGAD